MHFKLFQRLGYTVPLKALDLAVFGFVSSQLCVPRPSPADLAKTTTREPVDVTLR
jgi:hypothetical protein